MLLPLGKTDNPSTGSTALNIGWRFYCILEVENRKGSNTSGLYSFSQILARMTVELKLQDTQKAQLRKLRIGLLE